MMTNQDESKRGPKEESKEEKKIPIDGFQQVLAMLKVADKDFRESLLKRLAERDSRLAQQLRAQI